MINFEKWFNNAFDLINNGKNYEALRSFKGALFRVLDHAPANNTPAIISDNLMKFFEALFSQDLIHEISQIISYYIEITKKKNLPLEYIYILSSIPMKLENVDLAIEIYSIYLQTLENYTNIEKKDLLGNDFEIISMERDHIFPYQIEPYKKGKYIKQSWFESMPDEMFRILEKKLGWHILITAKLKV